ncbi:HD domain-containing phosphohydrolase [Thermovirga sp.]|uniref:HD domain-containing phosphohydrolase n=1 Tax=Thermovirga sp. TaxID=2699834 RepID=UPI0025F6609A|nr:HD domain-containing phosphohydrolase [Thermovirga sp.]MBO8153728.1 PAS domain S-box protein [Thermovirga sp.]
MEPLHEDTNSDLDVMSLLEEYEGENFMLNYLFKNAPLGMVRMGCNGVVAEANKAACEMFGYRDREMSGKKIKDLILPETKRPSGEEYIYNLYDERQVVEFEDMRRKKDGSFIYVSFLGFPILRKGKILGAFVIYQDITKRKEEEKSLKKSISNEKVKTNVMTEYWEQTISVLSSTIEAKDPYTAGHQKSVAIIAKQIAEQIGLSEEEAYPIFVAAMVHDIGKIEIPSEILAKPGKLSLLESKLVQKHAEAGKRILSQLKTEWSIDEIVYQHHERLDGSGYPRGLMGGEILLAAKIIAVADVVDAMSSHRPYRPALSMDNVLGEINRGKGILYDEDVVDAWMETKN